MFHLIRQSQCPHEVGEIVGQGVKLESDGVVAELAARQPCPFDRVLVLLDVLLRLSALIVERHGPFRRPGQVGEDKAIAGIRFTGMPFHLGNDPALSLPAPSLIAETSIIAPHMVRRTANGARQQVSNIFLENRVGLEADGVDVAFGFQELIDVR